MAAEGIEARRAAPEGRRAANAEGRGAGLDGLEHDRRRGPALIVEEAAAAGRELEGPGVLRPLHAVRVPAPEDLLDPERIPRGREGRA